MTRKRVLFYIEPVTYCDNPSRLTGWLNLFSQFAAKSRDLMTCAIATSSATASGNNSEFCDVYILDPIAFLAPHDFDRVAYSRDICLGGGCNNRIIIDCLGAIKESFNPDVVITCSDNSYLKRVFGPGQVIFMELGPLPRHGMKTAIYMDPWGHQVGSAFDRFVTSPWDHGILQDVQELWKSEWLANIEEESRQLGITDWLARESAGHPVLLLALQPRDWLTYEGIGPALDPLALLQRTAFYAGTEWIVVPQWHPVSPPVSEDLAASLMESQANIRVPPPGWRVGHSELFLPHVDRVTTISSNVGVTGLILGKAVSALGKAKFRALAGGHAVVRTDILAFMASRYCRLLEDFLTIEGAFAEHALRLHQNPNWLLDPNGIKANDLTAFFNHT